MCKGANGEKKKKSIQRLLSCGEGRRCQTLEFAPGWYACFKLTQETFKGQKKRQKLHLGKHCSTEWSHGAAHLHALLCDGVSSSGFDGRTVLVVLGLPAPEGQRLLPAPQSLLEQIHAWGANVQTLQSRLNAAMQGPRNQTFEGPVCKIWLELWFLYWQKLNILPIKSISKSVYLQYKKSYWVFLPSISLHIKQSGSCF